MKIKLKHKHLLHSGDIASIMKECYGFKDYGVIKKIFKFHKIRDEVISLINSFDGSVIDRGVLMYTNLDELKYGAVLKLQSEFNADYLEWENFYNHVARVNSIITNQPINYHMNKDSDSEVLLYNSIRNAYEDNQKKWGMLFDQEAINDIDYQSVAGNKLERFSRMSTVVYVCNSFNIDYESALDVSYGNVQTLLLMKATNDKIQYDLSKVKERKLRKGT